MEAVIAFAGILLGWVLAELTERRRRLADARVAGTLIAAELLEARNLLHLAIEEQSPLHYYPATSAWDAYASSLMRWKGGDLAVPLVAAYSAITTDVSTLQWLDAQTIAAREQMAALTDGHRMSEVTALEPREKELLKKRIDLSIHKVSTLESTLSDYLNGMSSSLDKIDDAVARLKPYVNAL